MAVGDRGIPTPMQRALQRPQRQLPPRQPSALTSGTIFQASEGYEYVGRVVVENYQLVEDTVPEAVHRLADRGGDVEIKLRSETIIENGRMVSDRIEAEYFVRKPPPFLCC